MTDEKKENLKRAFYDEPPSGYFTKERLLMDRIKTWAFPIVISLVVTLSTALLFVAKDLYEEVHATHDDVIQIKTEMGIIIPDYEKRISFLEGEVGQYNKEEKKENGGNNNTTHFLPSMILPKPILLEK
jgi:hypothetical protein